MRLEMSNGEQLTLDIVLVSQFLENVWNDREGYRVEEHELRVVSRAGLAKMKRAAGRPKDLADLTHLGLDEHEDE